MGETAGEVFRKSAAARACCRAMRRQLEAMGEATAAGAAAAAVMQQWWAAVAAGDVERAAGLESGLRLLEADAAEATARADAAGRDADALVAQF